MDITTTLSTSFSTQRHMPKIEGEWLELEVKLRPFIQNFISRLNLVHWRGGAQLLGEDTLSETLARAICYARKAEHGIVPPIDSFEALCKTIAKNYLLDLRRKDKHLAYSIDTISPYCVHQYVGMSTDPINEVIEEMMVYAKMLLVSKSIKNFTPKLKEAMLIHLANMEDFDDEQPRPLERAMWAVGIPLREYQCELPKDPVLRSRHSALVCLGLKTLRQTFCDPPHQPDTAA